MAHPAASSSRLLGDWLTSMVAADPDTEWTVSARSLADRASDLVATDPNAAALVEAVIGGVLGAEGLRLRSLYALDDALDTSDDELAIRRRIERLVADASWGHRLDAGHALTRQQIETQLLWGCIVHGDSFAVRTYDDQAPAGARTRWRVIDARRVRNPADKRNSPTLYEGIVYDELGRRSGIWVWPRSEYTAGASPAFVRWYAQDGTPNVIHRCRLRRPGSVRGLSWFAPLLVLAKHLAGTTEAYAVAKRVQACHPLIVKSADHEATKLAEQAGARLGPYTKLAPGRVYYTDYEAQIEAPDWNFNGADLRDFIDANLRSFTAAWGLPFEFVLAQLTQSNLAASRTALLQYYRACAAMQDEHLAQATQPIDLSILREGLAAGLLPLPSGAPISDQALLRGRYLRPPRHMPDPLKEAQAAKAWSELDRSSTSIFAEMGWSYDDEVMQKRGDVELKRTQLDDTAAIIP